MRRVGPKQGQLVLFALALSGVCGVVFAVGVQVGKELGSVPAEETPTWYPITDRTPLAVRDPDLVVYEELLHPPTPTPTATSPPTPAPRATPGLVPTESRPWTVQVLAARSRTEAEAAVARLRRRGYDAYVLRVPAGEGSWYRVRVGHFRTREEAQRVERRLRREEGMEGAFVTAR
ncbi:MAG: hypothetical protein KatS3mg076_2256 [Candidatus Binatia bacterium]|nr:MAG: hypothetical protein KatS3mg076_2256 [Candidatus Binatia bacterium]